MISLLHLFAILAITMVVEASDDAVGRQRCNGERASSISIAPAAGCTNRCGDLTVNFPFGIGRGCSRSSDFELTCDNTTQPAKLFFFCDSTTQVTQSIVIAITENGGSSTSDGHMVSFDFTYTISMNSSAPVIWSLPRRSPGRPFIPSSSLDSASSGLRFSGCDFDVHWLDPPPVNSNTPPGRSESTSCRATCPDGERTDMATAASNCGDGTGIRCCRILFGDVIDSAKLKFVHHDIANNRTVVYHNRSFLWYTINVTSAYGEMESLAWKISDQPTCASAPKDNTTYACVSRNSFCEDQGVDMDPSFGDSGGYTCNCKTRYTGNPYVVDGCKLDNGYNPSQRKSNCTRRCGSVDVPFPFGLKKGCFAREQFHLKCNNTASSTSTLLLDSTMNYHVTNINVEEGLIEYISPDEANPETDISTFDGQLHELRSLYLSSGRNATVSVQWVAAQLTCEEAKRNKSEYACAESECITIHTSGYFGYSCRCASGYHGNPYIKRGCRASVSAHLAGGGHSRFSSFTSPEGVRSLQTECLADGFIMKGCIAWLK